MGSLYLLVALEAGVDGTLFSMRVRSELAVPFVSRVYNVLITAHAFLMIFFLTRNVRGAGLAHRWMRVWPARPTSLGGVRYGVHCPR